MAEKIFLGTVLNNEKSISNERIYIEKHTWDCSWYWGFGYIGNKNLHTHFESNLLGSVTDIDQIFVNPRYSQSVWWIIRDLFIQAYALQKMAEVYRHGGHQTSKRGVTDLIKDLDKADVINADLKKVLDTLWDILENKKLK